MTGAWPSYRKPPAGAMLDRANPFARGLQFFYGLTEGGGPVVADMASGLNITTATSGTSWAAGTNGPAILCNSTTAGGQVVVPTANRIVNWPITVACSARFNAAPANNAQIFGIAFDNANGTPFAILALFASSATHLGWFNDSGVAGGVNTGTIYTPTAGVDYVFAATITPNSQLYYLNGVLVSSTANAYTAPRWGSLSNIFFGSRGGAAVNANMVFNWGGVWNRSQTAGEHLALAQFPTQLTRAPNPWQFGMSSGLNLSIAKGSFGLTGRPSVFNMGLAAAKGVFTETGRAATFGMGLAAAKGTYAETGRAAAFDMAMPAAKGVFTETGRAASFNLGMVMSAAKGILTQTGRPATFDYKLAAAKGSYNLTGRNATLTVSGNLTLAIAPGHFGLTGHDATFGGLTVPLSFREAIYAWLAANTDLAAVVGDRIYFSNPDRDAAYPNLAFSIHKGNRSPGRSYGRNLSGANGISIAYVTFTATGFRASDCVAAIEAVAGLQDFVGTLSGVEILDSFCELEWDTSIKPPSGDGAWVQEVAAEYRIKHRATPRTA